MSDGEMERSGARDNNTAQKRVEKKNRENPFLQEEPQKKKKRKTKRV